MDTLKIAIIYNPNDNKLSKKAYSQTYRGQFLALMRLSGAFGITEHCNAENIDANVIIFYDVHSTHHIRIEGIEKHKAVKYEYINDPHQEFAQFAYKTTNQHVVKLGAEERAQRILDRGIDFVICPYVEPYYEYIAPHLQGLAEKMLVWFPPAPNLGLFKDRFKLLKDRNPKILGNGATRETTTKGYATRILAHRQPYIFYVPHFIYIEKYKIPCGEDYPNFLTWFSASIAITDDHIVPKFLEIPLAGCVCFAIGHQDYKNMGFVDGENCYFVDKSNLKEKAEYFLNHIEEHQDMANAGRELIESKWTSQHFAEFIYKHAETQCAA